MEIIPAIDVAGGRLARSTTTGATAIEAFGGDPASAARAFIEAGARWLHVVDLDTAPGEPRDLDVLAEIASLGVPVQASGGIASASQVDRALSSGAKRVVLGSAALAERDATAELIALMGETLAVGIEADGPTIRPRGPGARELPLWDTLLWLADLDVHRFVYTEVGHVDAMTGPDLDGMWALATHTGKPVIASGGVRGRDDLLAIARLGPGIEGVVVGRALYEGLDLAAAIAAVA